MSAIAGIVLLDHSIDCTALIHKLTAAMSRRGPDARGHWVSGNVALGHCMLRTTPESINETQPTMSWDGQLTIVMDGRLDNLDELRRKLNRDGSLPNGTPDAQYVLAGYERWGREVARRLLGDFAFIIWDARAQTLYCARDCMGAKPLLLVQTRKYVAFASDGEAFLGLPEHYFRPNAELIASLFVSGISLPNELSDWDENVIAVNTGEYLTVDRHGRLERQRFWSLDLPPVATFRDEAEAASAFEEVFCDALRCRMRASGRVATLMSGGMDSAAIAAFAPNALSELGSSSLTTFSAVSEPSENCIESDAIRALIALPHLNARTMEVPSLEGGPDANDLTKLAWQGAHPVDNSLLIVLALGLTARRAGHKVLLHGASGDLAMQSPSWYLAPMLRQGRLREGWQEAVKAQQFHTYLRGMSMQRLLFRNTAAAFAPSWLRELRVRAHHGLLAGVTPDTPLNPVFEKDLNLPARRRFQSMVSARNDPCDWRGEHLRALAAIHHGLLGYDRTGAQLGIETRDPWGDRRVVEFFLSLPLNLKVNKGWTKYLARATCAPSLPEGVPWRSDKSHVGWKFTYRLMEAERPALVRNISMNEALIAPYLDVDRLRSRVRKYAEQGGIEDLDFCYEVLVLTRWLRRMTTK